MDWRHCLATCQGIARGREDPISSLDQAAMRSHTRILAGHPGPTRPIGFSSFKNYGSGLAKLAVAIHHVDVDDVIVINLQDVNLQHKLAAAAAASVGYDIFAIAYGRIRLIHTGGKKKPAGTFYKDRSLTKSTKV
jgi:hypothetical protein